MMSDSFEVLSSTQSATCFLCHRQFTQPKALACLHTFCEECLQSYVGHRHDNNNNSFPCPICRQIIYLPDGGVARLPDNRVLLMLQDRPDVPGSRARLESITESRGNSPPPPSYEEVFGGKAFDLEASDVSLIDNPSVAKLIKTFGSHGSEADQCTFLSGLAINQLSEEIITIDCSMNKITIFSLRGQFIRSWICDCSIRDVCVTNQGTLLVTVSRSGSALLREYKPDGRLIGVFGNFYYYDNPSGIAINSLQKIIVTSLEKSMIHVLTERKRTSINFGSKGSGPNHFMHPYYVSINSHDDIVISDSGNHRVKVHGMNGQLKLMIGSQGHKEGQFFYPMDVCVDKWDNIYVADSNNYRVQVFSPEGQFLAAPITKTFEYGADVKPTNIALFGDNKIIVALRGTKFCQINIYEWQLAAHVRSISGFKSGGCCGLLCCFSSSIPYDDL